MQTNRLFQIIYILLREGTVTAGELAKRFEVSPRTIYRDIDALSLAGVSVYASKGKGGGISLLQDFVLDKSLLSETEQLCRGFCRCKLERMLRCLKSSVHFGVGMRFRG